DCEMLAGAGGRLADDAFRRLAIRQGSSVRARGQCRKVFGRRSRFPWMRAGRDDPRWLRLRQGVSCRALLAGIADPPHRAREPGVDLELHRREGPGFAEVVLMEEMPNLNAVAPGRRGPPIQA